MLELSFNCIIPFLASLILAETSTFFTNSTPSKTKSSTCLPTPDAAKDVPLSTNSLPVSELYTILPTLFADEPYGEMLYGKVVDMFYFPIWSGNLPEWIPFVGGDMFTFFQYIFNPADAYISIGVALLFIFSKQAFPKEEKEVEKKEA